MNVLLIGNLTDQYCGFANFSHQMITALQRAGVDVTPWDGTYPTIYARREAGEPYAGFFPAHVKDYDIVHLIWNAMVMNHYHGADWEALAGGPLVSWWDGGPSDACCPFEQWMTIRWSDYPRPGYHHLDYPVPDWVDALPPPDPVFTVGASSVRGDGVADIRQACARRGWALNLPVPGVWRSIDDEIWRLARSTVNVCWYHTAPLWHNRASAPSMLLASKRPLLINDDPLVAHLAHAEDVYHGTDLEEALDQLAQAPTRRCPIATADQFSWTHAVERFAGVWEDALSQRSRS